LDLLLWEVFVPAISTIWAVARVGLGFYRTHKEEIHTLVDDAKKLFNFEDKGDLQKAIFFVTEQMLIELDSQKSKLDSAGDEMEEILNALEATATTDREGSVASQVILMSGIKSLQHLLQDGYDRNMRMRRMVAQLLGKQVQTQQRPMVDAPMPPEHLRPGVLSEPTMRM
jgi:hypothetical protein